MWFYTKFINRTLVLEGWFEKPKNRLFVKIRLLISSDGRKKMGSRDKLQDVMNGWPLTGWSGKPRIPDSIYVTKATTKRK
jgi:hypothetical protein